MITTIAVVCTALLAIFAVGVTSLIIGKIKG